MIDLISRQEAIDSLNDEFTIIGKTNAVIVQDYIRRVNNRLRSLPSAQPEIIRCKDCEHYDDGLCRRWKYSHVTSEDSFCSGAERREE